jgi:hypothetical protein
MTNTRKTRMWGLRLLAAMPGAVDVEVRPCRETSE